MKGGQLIREARRRAGLTQAELAARLDTKQSVVARWESNRVSPSLETITEAVRACGFDIDFHLIPHDAQDVAQALQNMRLAPDERIDLLLNQLEVERWAQEVRAASDAG